MSRHEHFAFASSDVISSEILIQLEYKPVAYSYIPM